MTGIKRPVSVIRRLHDHERRISLLETVDPPVSPPAVAPDVFLVGGPGFLTASWPEIPGAAEYEVYISDQFDFEPAEETLVMITPATAAVIRTTADNVILKYEKPYYVKVVPRNAAGKASVIPNNPGAAIQLQDKDIESISADKITAGEISAGVLISGLIYSPAADGWRVEIGDEEIPLRYWDGITTHFSVNLDGLIYGKSLLIENDDDFVGITIRDLGLASALNAFELVRPDFAVAALMKATNAAGAIIDVAGKVRIAQKDNILNRLLTVDVGQAVLGHNTGRVILGSDGAEASQVEIALNKASVLGFFGAIGAGTAFELSEVATDPAAPDGTNFHGRFYMRDNGAGKSQFVVRFPTGAIQVLATEP